jgi:hypothetical protein
MPSYRRASMSAHQNIVQRTSNHNFRIKCVFNTVPNNDLTGTTAITNTNSVTTLPDSRHGFVLRFLGNNYLSVAVSTPSTSTKTFWLYSVGPGTGGNVFSSSNYTVTLNTSNQLQCVIGGTTVTSSYVQPVNTWTFYVITTTPTAANIYVNTNPNPYGTAVLSTFTGDTNPIYFGSLAGSGYYTGYMDDIRLFQGVVNTNQIAGSYLGN